MKKKIKSALEPKKRKGSVTPKALLIAAIVVAALLLLLIVVVIVGFIKKGNSTNEQLKKRRLETYENHSRDTEKSKEDEDGDEENYRDMEDEEDDKSSVDVDLDEEEEENEDKDYLRKSSKSKKEKSNSEVTDKNFSFEDEKTPEKKPSEGSGLRIKDIVKIAKPGVVAISTERAFNTIFGESILLPAAGSGFIISEDGYVATNNHVIEDSQNIKLSLPDGTVYDAEVVGSDPLTDVCVLKIVTDKKIKFPYLKFGNSSILEEGDTAIAIGNPTGTLQGSVSAGIISGLERNITVEGLDMTVLQTDAAINSGNSGGALINEYGEVIGINVAKLSGDGRNVFEGLGFAIPSDTAKPIIENLIKYGYVKGRTQIGIYGEDVSRDAARYYDLGDSAGVYVRSVVRNGSAAEAGIRKGDLIVSFDGKTIEGIKDLNNAKKDKKPGDLVEVEFYRKGKKKSVEMELQEYVPVTGAKYFTQEDD